MADMESTYQNGGVQTTTQAPSTYAPNDDTNFFRELAMRRLKAPPPPAAVAPPAVYAAPRTAVGGGSGYEERPNTVATMRAIAAKNPAPNMKRAYVQQVFGANIVPGQVRVAGGPGSTFAGYWEDGDMDQGAVHHANEGSIGSGPMAPSLSPSDNFTLRNFQANAAGGQSLAESNAKRNAYLYPKPEAKQG